MSTKVGLWLNSMKEGAVDFVCFSGEHGEEKEEDAGALVLVV